MSKSTSRELMLLFLSTALTGVNISEKKLQLYLIKELLLYEGNGRIVYWDDVDTLLAEHGYAVTFTRAKELLLSTNLFRLEGTLLLTNETVQIDTFSFEPKELLAIIDEIEPAGSAMNSEHIRQAISKGLKWCTDITLKSKANGLEGLPAMLSCNGTNDEIIGLTAAGTAVYDALSLFSEMSHHLLTSDKSKNSEVFCFLTKCTLSFQCVDEGWDYGGFAPLEDQPEAFHPTVDATCLAILALSSFFSCRDKISEVTDIDINELLPHISKAIVDGLSFLFRMQLPDGAFGNYRYQNETKGELFITQPHENSTRFVLAAMGASKGSGVFEYLGKEDFFGKCDTVISSIFTYLCNHISSSDGLWFPYFALTQNNLPYDDGLAATARVGRSLKAVWFGFKDKRREVADILQNFAKHCLRSYNGHEAVSYYRFRTPTIDGYSTYFNWRCRLDEVVSYTLLEMYLIYDIPHDPCVWLYIGKTVESILKRQHTVHGHWKDTITGKPYIAPTLAAVELLDCYLLAINKKSSLIC